MFGCTALCPSHSAESLSGGTSQIEDTLYFGLSKKSGTVTEAEWQAFLNEVVTPKFPDGLTVLDANGQWRGAQGTIARENSKILLIIHGPESEYTSRIEEIIAEYRRRFEQESVLFTRQRINARF